MNFVGISYEASESQTSFGEFPWVKTQAGWIVAKTRDTTS